MTPDNFKILTIENHIQIHICMIDNTEIILQPHGKMACVLQQEIFIFQHNFLSQYL